MEEIRNGPCSDVEDRISRLEDALIHYILSFIDPKYAVQTSVLSKRWIDIWKSLPFLSFHRSSFSQDKKDSFVMFVDMVFIFRRKDIDVQSFRVDWSDSAYDDSVTVHVNRWCLNAIEYNVREVRIIITQFHNSAYEFPHRLFNCKSLRMLVINLFGNARYVDFILPRSMNLPRLKVLAYCGLSISGVEFSKSIFPSCPVLETLHVVDCDIHNDKGRNLIVDSLSLKEFKYAFRHLLQQNDSMVNIVKLSAPNLAAFTWRFFLTHDYSLENCSPLSQVHFDTRLKEEKEEGDDDDDEEEDEDADTYSNLPSKEKLVYAKRMMKLLGAVCMVKKMILSPGFLEVLSQAPDLLDCQPPRLCSLESLMLEIWSTRNSLRSVAYLLKISPSITGLFLQSMKSNLANIGADSEAGLSSPEMLSCLEFVKIDDVEACDAEFKLLTFLLKNAKVLERVDVIFSSSIFGSRASKRQVELFIKKLRAVPTASSSIDWYFMRP